jgi:hypothetical protein
VFDNQGGAGYPPALRASTQTHGFLKYIQRLPNGNTLITEGMHGRIFQVTPSGRVVWEYLTPYEETRSQANPR